MFFQLLFAGLANGSIYALVALAITVIFKGTGVVNFVAGEVLMISAFIFFTLNSLWKIPYIISFLITAFPFAIALGLAMERVVIRPLAPYGHLTVVISTIAMSIAFKGITRLIWGSNIQNVLSPFTFQPINVSLGPVKVVISSENASIIIASLLIMAIFLMFFRYFKLGKKMRGTLENEMGARLVGINVKHIYATIWTLGTIICAIAAILFVPISTLHIEMGAKVMFKAFAAGLLGGFGSLHGAMIGGILMGITESLFGGYVSTAMMDISSLLVIAIVLVLKPQGLFGGTRIIKV